ncbi:MAG: hypothetical protein IPN94_25915 [Sphingobacteriales bacterium]|nr:hypothetical protein [Sphingobacteriales bacterium]
MKIAIRKTQLLGPQFILPPHAKPQAPKGTIYWGYNFQITAPDEQKEVKHLFVNLFLFIYNYFHLSTETTKIENFG